MNGFREPPQSPDFLEGFLAKINLLAPIGPGDPLATIIAERRRAPLARVLDRARRLGADVSALQEITSNLSKSAFEEVNTHPFFSRWLHKVVAGLARGGDAFVQDLAPLGNLVLVPALRDGIITNTSLPIFVNASGIAQLFAKSGGGYLTDVAMDARIEVVDDVVVWGRTAGRNGTAHIEYFLRPSPVSDPFSDASQFRPFTRIESSNIVLDAFHPWLSAFMEELNDQDAGERAPDLEPVIASDENLNKLADALAVISRACPGTRAEIEALVVQIAPFASSWRRAFTNTSWQGLIFLNADMSDKVALVDRLIHETSHLRLNAIQTVAPLHSWPRGKTLQSPFRSGPRPLDGVYHGIFVFSRVCRVLEQVARVTGDADFLVPINGMRAQIQSGLDALISLGGSTSVGRRLIEEVSLEQERFKYEGVES